MKKTSLALSVAFILGVAPVAFAAPQDGAPDGLEVEVEDSFNNNDLSEDNSIKTSEDNSVDVDVKDSFNIDHSFKMGDIVVNKVKLEGEIAATATALGDTEYESKAVISDGSFSNAAGVFNVSQNTGINGLVQQGASVQGNLTLGK